MYLVYTVFHFMFLVDCREGYHSWYSWMGKKNPQIDWYELVDGQCGLLWMWNQDLKKYMNFWITNALILLITIVIFFHLLFVQGYSECVTGKWWIGHERIKLKSSFCACSVSVSCWPWTTVCGLECLRLFLYVGYSMFWLFALISTE